LDRRITGEPEEAWKRERICKRKGSRDTNGVMLVFSFHFINTVPYLEVEYRSAADGTM
jgi:hypothetical protein